MQLVWTAEESLLLTLVVSRSACEVLLFVLAVRAYVGDQRSKSSEAAGPAAP